MNIDIYEILKKYWAYAGFRSLQEDIILSVLAGNDTLALMPTGGGKSITFQVPALAREGICLVITPLISLMKDQVENLRKRGINAVAIHSGMSFSEIDIALNNCMYGDCKFLYLSPERLSTDIFKTRVQKLNVNLIAVDEAHCISQWGYDFRPSYLKIAELRELIPTVTILALTATATHQVAEDIMSKLLFKQPKVYSKSFERKNLAYVVRNTEDKLNYIPKILNNVAGSSIIYVRNRKKTKEIALMLRKLGFSASFYHAGLSDQERAARQDEWKGDFTRIMVATNAFGMGIDKPDVRIVIHIEPPDSIEAYFQEAGRAGRDGQKAYAIVLCDPNDKAKLERKVDATFPEIQVVKNVYQSLGNFLQVPFGGGKNLSYDFDLGAFCSAFSLSITNAYNCLKILQREGYIEFSEDVNNPSKVHFVVGRDDLYKFQVANATFDGFIKLLLRSYTGLFTDYVIIDEQTLARRSKVSPDTVYQFLVKLSSMKIIKFIPRKHTPLVTYTEERLDEKTIYISSENYHKRRDDYSARVQEVVRYTFSNDKCRSRLLIEYFGQKNPANCGVCDVCLKKSESGLNFFEFEEIKKLVSQKLAEYSLPIQKLVEDIDFNNDKVIKAVRWMLDTNYLCYMDDSSIMLKK